MYEEAASILNSENIPLTKVDCVEESPLYWKYNIKSFPTLFAFVLGEPIAYDGALELNDITEFMRNLKKSSVLNVDHSSIQQFTSEHLSSSSPVIILYVETLGSDLDTRSIAEFDLVCKRVSVFTCGMSTNVNYASQHFNVKIFPSVVMLTSFEDTSEDKVVLAPTGLSAGGLATWIKTQGYSTLVDFDQRNDEVMFSDKRPGYFNHILLFVDKSSVAGVSLVDQFRRVGGAYRGRGVFIVVDVGEQNMAGNEYVRSMATSLGVTSRDAPACVIVKSATTRIQFYRYSGGITGSDMADPEGDYSQFVKGFFDETLEATQVIETKSK